MRKVVVVLLLLAVVLHATPVFAGEEKVTICHRPPGNAENGQVVRVGFKAAIAHLAHGDNVGECQPIPTVRILEVFACDEWKHTIIEGEDVVFQHGIGFGTFEQALSEREGERVFFLLDGEFLEPVFYEGITFHTQSGLYGDRGRVLWTPTAGTHTVQSWWTHPNEGPPEDTCTFTVSSN